MLRMLLLFLTFTSVLSCKVGNDASLSIYRETFPGGKWFLSTLSPATCSGSFYDYNISFYTSSLNIGSTYNVTLAIWKQVGSKTYEKDPATIQHYTYTHTNNRRKKRATLNTAPFSSAVGIRKGSFVGAYLYTTANALPITGIRYTSRIGACVSKNSASVTTITCSFNHYYVVHAEADVVKVDCGAPPSVLNATYSQLDNDTEYGARVQYNCSTGYNINGNDTISCLLNASWFSPTPSCSLVNCGNPGEPANGYTNDNVFTNFTPNSNQYNYGTTVSFNCNPGYGLVGVSTLTCTATGQWSNNIPLCIATTRSSSSSVNSATTLSTSSSVMPTTSVDGSNNLLVIGGVIGAMLLILLILIVAIPLIVLLVARSKRNSRELNDPATTNLINPITAPSEEHSTSDYDDPALTLKHESVPLLYSELESLKNEDDNKYPTEEVYDDENIANVALPPLIHLDVDDDTEGVANSLYFIQEEAEEKDEGGAGAVYFTLDEDAATGSDDKKDLPVYFTLENERKTVPKFNARKLAKRNTVAFIQPGESEDEIYGQIEYLSKPMIYRDSLILSTIIGSGQFGNVCKGQWKKPNGDTIDVAVKMLQDGASEQEKIKFLQEAAIMSQFTHANVIKLHGVVSDDEHPLIVIEYMPKGDLFGVLQKMRPDPGELVHQDTPALLLSFCQQVCLGMTYLSSKGFVHRDLAARNILVSADNICKIIDFGLSRDIEDENYYVSRKGAMIPVKWTAPEALNYRKYSTASDVWSYGCLMYEIWSIGRKPYEEDTNATALRKITSSERLPPPPGCPEAMYSLMISCWHPVASERPNFHEIMVSLLQPNKNILTIPESALSSHPQAGSLGGTLKAGENMYPEMQHYYSDTIDTAL